MHEKDEVPERLLTLRPAERRNRPHPQSAFRATGYLRSCLLLLLAGVLFSGCASVPKDYPRTQSAAFQDHESTAIGRYLGKAAARHPGESGFAIIRYGPPAFTSRVALTELAEQTLDLQYYIWEADATGRILAERLVQAADRGVRVRLLVDDINLKGRDAVVAAMDAHPNIEIRLFNPFARRSAHALDFLTDFNRVNHRMHNKLMVMDNAVAIVGGRNIGNHYFGVATEANFRDLDIAAGGPVVREISSVFDHFWSGDWAVPISALVERPYTEEDLRTALKTIRERIAEDDYPHPLDQDVTELKSELRGIFNEFIWAPGRIVWDDPATIQRTGSTSRMAEGLSKRIGRLESELLIESAYFVPRDPGIETVKGLNDRGVRIRVLTNSLASNDVLAAHAGYSKRRGRLIANGVELYELRPDPEPASKNVIRGTSKAALHTKAMVFDRKDVFIGSFNLDPRSGDINTEAGLYVESPELATQVIAYMDEGVRPQNSYRVLLDEDGELYWVTEDDGLDVRYDKDPKSSAWQRSVAGFIRILPVEDQL
ncbi:MAG: phospholipase D family protein [Pseudomonadota bacterium]|nr:phospholipase D family protein [Pseudomonadota bacterium]